MGARRGAQHVTFPDSPEIPAQYRGKTLYVVFNTGNNTASVYTDVDFIGKLEGYAKDWLFGQIDPDYRPLSETENKIQEDYTPRIIKVDAVVSLKFPDDIDSPYSGQERYVLIMPGEDDENKTVRLLPEMDELGENLGDDLTELALRSFRKRDSKK